MSLGSLFMVETRYFFIIMLYLPNVSQLCHRHCSDMPSQCTLCGMFGPIKATWRNSFVLHSLFSLEEREALVKPLPVPPSLWP